MRRSAYTLVELVMGMMVLTIILAGTTSAIFLASQALPDGQDALARVPRGADAVQRMIDELGCAVSFTARTSTAVEFKVADRDSDDVEETIRYAWSETAGDPLTRRYNGGAVISVAEDVHALDLKFSIITESETTTVTEEVESDETLFAEFDGWNGIPPSSRDYPVSPTSWCTERFTVDKVTFPPGATGIRISRVQIKLKKASGGTSTTLGVHRPTAAGSTVAQPAALGTPATLATTFLTTTYDWKDFNFSDVDITGLANEFVLVVKGSLPTSANVKYLYALLALADTPVMRWTANSGGSWSPPNQGDFPKQDMHFRVYGRYKTTQTVEDTVTRYWVRSATVALQVGPEAAFRVETEVQTLNTAEVAGP